MRAFVFIVVAASLVACRATKPIQTAIAKKDTVQQAPVVNTARQDSIKFIQTAFQQLNANRIDFRTFSSKVNVDYSTSEGKKYNLNANIRMARDSAIWISVNAILGIEALRVLITPDSVKLLNKQNKTYTARSISYLQEVTSLPLNLPILQDLIIGNPVFLDSAIVSYSQSPGAVSLLSLGSWFKNLVTVSEDSKLLQHSKLDDADATRNRTADLTYSDYENKRGPQFATRRIITISEKKKLDIRLDFKQYDFNGDVSFPFSIPRNYTRD